MNNDKYMNLALKEAMKAYKKGDVPVGAIIVKNNKIIARAYNKKEKNNIVTHHAEILAIEKACKKIHSWHLDNCILYVTLEPCMMCCGAIFQSRIKKVYYATKNINQGYIKNINQIEIKHTNNEQSLLSSNILKTFFREKRK